MKHFFDKKNNRLVFIHEKATASYWDSHWKMNEKEFINAINSGSRDLFVKWYTNKFVPKGGRVLEGGCGKGQYVHAFKNWNYDSYGIDYAKDTVQKVNKLFPELNIIQGDVRDLPYDTNFFDAYWSFGVIEHFYEGYEKIVREMKRVVKPGGHIFVTIPVMSKLRQLKANRGDYPLLDNNVDLSSFYQFALDKNSVIENFKIYKLTCIQQTNTSGLKGLKDESKTLKPILKKLYDINFLPLNVFKKILSQLLAPFSGHTILLIFKNKK